MYIYVANFQNLEVRVVHAVYVTVSKNKTYYQTNLIFVVAMLGFCVPPTPKDIQRLDLSFKSKPKDVGSPESNP